MMQAYSRLQGVPVYGGGDGLVGGLDIELFLKNVLSEEGSIYSDASGELLQYISQPGS